MQRFKFLTLIAIYLVLCVHAFNTLIVQQENILRKYFITSPQDRIREYNTTLSDSIFKYFVRENKEADLKKVEEYIRRYGRTSLFETTFIYKDEVGRLFQISKAGVEPVSKDGVDLTTDNVYPVSIDNGRMDGYLVIMIKDTRDTEYEEGLKKYRFISFSLRVLYLLFIFAIAVIALYHNYSKKMRLARDMAEAKASNDGLTGLYTHEYFMKLLQIEIDKFQIYRLPFGVIMLDVDKFKSINDEYGHVAGDQILQAVARTIKSTTRSTDIAARYGGEEFAVLMPSAYTFEEKAQQKTIENFVTETKNLAERIRKSVAELEIRLNDGKTVRVTVSMGLSFCHKRREAVSPTALLEKADAALYRAKDGGRNRMFIDQDSISA
jgi:diguanylate cyclase (GGDEF)-like protein